MAELSIISGTIATKSAEFRTNPPTNMEPVIVNSRLSRGQLRTTPGTRPFTTGPGRDRAGILWNGVMYRVMGPSLVRVAASGAVTNLGGVIDGNYAALDYSFDRLAIVSGGALYYYDGLALAQVIDEDLGLVLDMIWIDGYFMTTDGQYVVVTELIDPTQVKPIKYGSTDEDPDPVTGLLKLHDEAYVLNRYTIQVLQNAGGNGFPFGVVSSATIPFGCVSASAKCLFGQTFAFVGSARGDALGVYVAGQGDANKISTRIVDAALAALSDPAVVELERRVYGDELRLFVHLPDESWVFFAKASEAAQEPVWSRMKTGADGYRPRHAVSAYGGIVVGSRASGALAYLDDTSPTLFNSRIIWQFDAGMIPAPQPQIIHSVELIGLPGRTDNGAVFLSYTRDGETFSMEREVTLGPLGNRTKRIAWRPHVRVSNYLGFRFRGYGVVGFASCQIS